MFNNKDNFNFSPGIKEDGGMKKLTPEEIKDIANKAAEASKIEAVFFQLYIEKKEKLKADMANPEYATVVKAINSDIEFKDLYKLKGASMSEEIKQLFYNHLVGLIKSIEEVKTLVENGDFKEIGSNVENKALYHLIKSVLQNLKLYPPL